MMGVQWNVAPIAVGAANTLYPQIQGRSPIPGGGLHGAESANVDLFPRVAALHARIMELKEGLTGAALSLRQVDGGLASASRLLGEIKTRLTEITKQYPPFAIDSPQRVAYLNAITGLRKQLEALSFPPDARASGDVFASGSMNWPDTTLPYPRLPFVGDFEIPQLDLELVTDRDVDGALGTVTELQEKVVEFRADMWRDVTRFVKGLDARDAQALTATVAANLMAIGDRGISGDGYLLASQGS